MDRHWQRKRKILTLLSATQFISGEEMATKLGISRAAINKHIEALNDYGVSIFSVKGKGYKLAKPIYLVNETQLVNHIDNRCFYFDEINSTNAFMLQHAHELKSGDLCIAEYQSAGRGRRGRTWVSPYANHLYFSMLWQFHQGLSQAMGLSLVVGCSLAHVLQEMGIDNIGLKWPNDLYLDQAKVAGILIEMTGQADSDCQLIIGIGINLAMSKEQGETIDQPWSELSSVLNNIDKTQLMINLHQQLKTDLALFEQQGLTPFLAHWQKWDLFINKPIKLLMADKMVTGICRGIDEQGAVLLDTQSGIQSFIGGEISLRADIDPPFH